MDKFRVWTVDENGNEVGVAEITADFPGTAAEKWAGGLDKNTFVVSRTGSVTAFVKPPDGSISKWDIIGVCVWKYFASRAIV